MQDRQRHAAHYNPAAMAHAAIDMHTHILPPGWEDWAKRYGVSGWPSCRLHDACNATIYLGDKEFRRIDERSFSPARRIADMDAERIGLQLLSPVPVMLCYWGPPEATDAFARMQNDFIAGVVQKHPGRFAAPRPRPRRPPMTGASSMTMARNRSGRRAAARKFR